MRPAIGSRPVGLAVVGALAIAFSGLLVRLADVEPSTAALYRCVYALPFLLPLALLERRRFGRREPGQRRLAWIAGLFFAADLVLWHHAIAAVGAGLATVLANTQLIVVGIAAWALLGERPSRRLIAAVPLVLVGIVLISGVLGSDAYGEEPALGVLFGILTAIAYSGFLLVLRAGNRDVRRPAGPLLDATAAAAAGSLVAGIFLNELELVPSWPAHGWLLLLAVSAQVVGWLVISVSLPRLPAAQTALLLTTQPVGAVVFAMLPAGRRSLAHPTDGDRPRARRDRRRNGQKGPAGRLRLIRSIEGSNSAAVVSTRDSNRSQAPPHHPAGWTAGPSERPVVPLRIIG